MPEPNPTDKLKAIVLSAMLGAPFMSLVLFVIKTAGPHFFVWLWLLVFAFQLFLLTIYPVAIAPLFNKCVSRSYITLACGNRSLLSYLCLFFPTPRMANVSFNKHGQVRTAEGPRIEVED